MVDFDVILGMHWLAAYLASMDCFHKAIVFTPVGQLSFQLQGICGRSGIRIILALRARKMLSCVRFFASLVTDGNGKPTLASIPVVREYQDVFPN